METFPDKGTSTPCKIGDRSTSDVVVRLRTQEGRDDWFYCHSHVLIEKSKYFADRLSENWPTCQILDSRNCVEVYCQESEFNHYVTVLRLLYVITNGLTCYGVGNTLGMLRVAVELGCQQIVHVCVDYLQAVPWEEPEEEEILRIIPSLGYQAESIIARLQPVNPATVIEIFLATIRFATSSPSASMNELKTSAQEQLEYMLTEDDDVPLVTSNDELKSEVKKCVMNLLTRFYDLLEYVSCELNDIVSNAKKIHTLQFLLSDLTWSCQILTKMEIMKEFVHSWVEASNKIVKAIEDENQNANILETKLKVIEVTTKVLEAIGYGSVILPTTKRLHMVKVWLPFVRGAKPLIDSIVTSKEDESTFKMDGELWQILESAFVTIVLALPSGDQAHILTEWLGTEHIRYPDLTEAFEVWCYRSKVAKRRLTLFGYTHRMTNPSMTM